MDIVAAQQLQPIQDALTALDLLGLLAAHHFDALAALFRGLVGFLLGRGGPSRRLRFLFERLAIRDRDLIIVRMNFAEGQESVTVPAVLDECRLKRRLYPRDLGEIDVSLELLLRRGFKVKVVQLIPIDDDHPRFFGMARVDQHAFRHCF